MIWTFQSSRGVGPESQAVQAYHPAGANQDRVGDRSLTVHATDIPGGSSLISRRLGGRPRETCRAEAKAWPVRQIRSPTAARRGQLRCKDTRWACSGSSAASNDTRTSDELGTHLRKAPWATWASESTGAATHVPPRSPKDSVSLSMSSAAVASSIRSSRCGGRFSAEDPWNAAKNSTR